MEIDEFATQYIEGYLFKDLETLSRYPAEAQAEYGGVGYPLVASVMAGIELLGALVHEKEFDPDNGDAYFRYYWHTHLTALPEPICDQKRLRRDSQLGLAIRKLVRNGLAHTFTTKAGITVYKSAEAPPLRISARGVDIHAVALASHFMSSYRVRVRPNIFEAGRANQELRETMQRNVKALISSHEAEAATVFADLLGIPSLAPTPPPGHESGGPPTYAGGTVAYASRAPR